MGKKAIKDKKVRKFAKILRKGFRVKEIILFGSRARSEHLEDSDYDFIIVSEDFRKLSFFDRFVVVAELWKYREPIEVLCYTPEEFEEMKKRICVVSEALKYGIKV